MTQLLLLEDVYSLGRSGDLVKVKPGYAHNFLLPQKKALIATKATIRIQKKLQEQRAIQAAEDKLESEKLALRLTKEEFSIKVKVDQEGHLYGSVSAADIVRLLAERGITIDKNMVVLKKHIKTLGTHVINLKLKEGVEASFGLTVFTDTPIEVKMEQPLEEGNIEEGPISE